VIFRIAFRNILRHSRRTFLSALTIAAGMMVFIFMDSLLTGMDRAVIDNMINLTTSSVRVCTPAYDADRRQLPLEHGIPDPSGLMARAAALPNVRGVTSRTQFMGQLSNLSEVVPVIGTVVDPATDATVFSFARYLDGAHFGPESSHEILLGKRLAADLAVGVGDYITLYARTRYDSHNADEFRIAGLISSTDPTVNRSAVYITRAAAEGFLDLEGLVTEVAIAVRRRTNYRDFAADVRGVQAELSAAYPGLKMDPFMEIAADLLRISKVKKVAGYVIMAYILLIAGVGIFNTVFMSVYERIREVGVLRAHGMRPGQIGWLFLLEGVLTGVAGSALGVIAGVAVNWFMVAVGYPLDRLMSEAMAGDFPFYGTIYGEWNLGAYVFVVVFSMVVAVAAGIVPARRAASLEVTQALRFV